MNIEIYKKPNDDYDVRTVAKPTCSDDVIRTVKQDLRKSEGRLRANLFLYSLSDCITSINRSEDPLDVKEYKIHKEIDLVLG